MAVRFRCPLCRLRMEAPDKLAGRSVACKRCGETVTIQPAAVPAPAPEPEVVGPWDGSMPSDRPGRKRAALIGSGAVGLLVVVGVGALLAGLRPGRGARAAATTTELPAARTAALVGPAPPAPTPPPLAAGRDSR